MKKQNPKNKFNIEEKIDKIVKENAYKNKKSLGKSYREIIKYCESKIEKKEVKNKIQIVGFVIAGILTILGYVFLFIF